MRANISVLDELPLPQLPTAFIDKEALMLRRKGAFAPPLSAFASIP